MIQTRDGKADLTMALSSIPGLPRLRQEAKANEKHEAWGERRGVFSLSDIALCSMQEALSSVLGLGKVWVGMKCEDLTTAGFPQLCPLSVSPLPVSVTLLFIDASLSLAHFRKEQN